MTDQTPDDSPAAPGSGPSAAGQPDQWQSPPEYGQPVPGQPVYPPAHGAPPGYGAPPPGYGAPPPGYGAPPPGYGAPPPGYPVYLVPPPLNTYAILSLILAIFVLPPLGIYFGKKAQQQIAVTGERGIELAKAAVVVGWVLTIGVGAFFVIWCVIVMSFFIFGAAALNH